MKRLLIVFALIWFTLSPNTVYAANWVKVAYDDMAGNIYVDSVSLLDAGDGIVKVATKTIDPNGYTIALERYSLTYNSYKMDALLTYSNDGSLLSWRIIKDDGWSRIFGEEFQKIQPGASGIRVLEYLRNMHKSGLIPR